MTTGRINQVTAFIARRLFRAQQDASPTGTRRHRLASRFSVKELFDLIADPRNGFPWSVASKPSESFPESPTNPTGRPQPGGSDDSLEGELVSLSSRRGNLIPDAAHHSNQPELTSLLIEYRFRFHNTGQDTESGLKQSS